MLQTKYSRYKYTPDEMGQDEFLKRFVVREDTFNDIFKDIKSSNNDVANQHYIILGQRGQGKTTLLRKINIEVKNNKKLSKFLLPIKFAEEQYQIRSLCRLFEEVAEYLQTFYENDFSTILDDMEVHFEDDDYDLKCFSYLESAVKSKGKKLLLLIDNIDELIGKLSDKEQRRLREILLTSSIFRIVGGSTKMLEQHYDYSKPFYEFFKIIKLKSLNSKESKEFLLSIARDDQKEKINDVIQNSPARVETLRRITGGVPRTLVMLFDIFLDEDGNAFDDLLKILDEATPLYKHRMDDLPPALQDIVHTIAINWDGMLTKEIAQKTRIESKAVSAQLKKLEKYEIVESESIGKNKIYKIKERFFNIWYLMRFGRKKDRQRVEWLVKFLESWCSKEELEERAVKFIGRVRKGGISSSFAYNMTEALSYAGVKFETEFELKQEVKNYLQKIDSKLSHELSPTDYEVMGVARDIKNEGNIKKAIAFLKESNKSGSDIIEMIDLYEMLQSLIEIFYKAHPLVNENRNIDIKYKNIYGESLLYLLNDDFQKSYKTIEKILKVFKLQQIEINLKDYLIILISKGQHYQAKKFLEMPEYQLKEKYKPIWYALMTLMQDEFPDEIKKMGSELRESVDEVLKEVEVYKEKYKIEELS